ncbi:MAG: tryptophan synthase subunit alpha [Vicinamibacteria bacterium]
MSRARLKRLLKKSPQVSPFLVLGDPTPELSIELAKAAVDAGAGTIEIGFPYGDPVADGPSIQKADMRALAGGTSTSVAMSLLARIHEARPKTPLNLLVYANLVHARGFDRFARDAAEAGASSLLVPDVPLEESAPLKRACRSAGLAHVQLIGPLTPPSRLERIDRMADGFLYLVAHQGVTGVRSGDFGEIEALVSRTASAVRNPLCLGFGLSKPDQIARAFAAGARIAVVGSHLANVIGEVWEEGSSGREERLVSRFASAVEALVDSRERPQNHARHHAAGQHSR